MKDLSRLNIPKKTDNKVQPEPEKPKATKKKKIVVIAVVCLLCIAVASKFINKHLKKVKAEEQKAQQELQVKNEDTAPVKSDNKEGTTSAKETATPPEQATAAKKKKSNDKMVFTFYNNLKHNSVDVDVEPQAARTQYKYTYIYQIASFRNMDETNWYVKKMKEDGLNPQFKKVGNWVRMYIGPYDSKRAMAPDIIKLQRIGLNGGFPREISRTEIKPTDDTKKDSDSKNNKDDSSSKDKSED